MKNESSTLLPKTNLALPLPSSNRVKELLDEQRQRNYSTTSSTSSPNNNNVGAEILQSRAKWRRLADIDESNSTAWYMFKESEKEWQYVLQDSTSSSTSFSSQRISIAGNFILDGIHGRKIGYRLERKALAWHQRYHSNLYRKAYSVLVLLYMALATLEDDSSSKNPYSSLTIILEILFLSLFSLDVYLEWYMSTDVTRKKFILRQPWTYTRAVILFTMTLDLLLHSLSHHWWRPSRALRPFLLVARLRNVRVIFASCIRAFQRVLVVLSLLACVICFWGLVGYLLFSDSSNADGDTYYFSTLSRSLYTMLLIHTSVPTLSEAMTPYYHMSQVSALFFIAFVLLTNLFLFKLTIAVSYKSYKTHTEHMLFKRLQKRKVALYAAFQILCDNEFVKRDSWLQVSRVIRPRWKESQHAYMFDTVAEEADFVNIKQFYQLCSLSNVKMFKVYSWPINSKLQRMQAAVRQYLEASCTVGSTVTVNWSEVIVGLCIMLSVIQAIQVNYLEVAFSSHHVWRLVGMLLLVLFTTEVGIKLFAYSWPGFVNRPFCVLDLTIVLVGWIFYTLTATLTESTNSHHHSSAVMILYDLALVIRVLRFIKFLNLIPAFRDILATTTEILPLVLRLFAVFFSFVFAVAVYAQDFYGKPLRRYSETMFGPELLLGGADVAQLDTILHSMFTLTQVMILSGWKDIMENVVRAVNGGTTTYLFFFIYRISVSNVLMPIFVGFLVESFVTQSKSSKSGTNNNATMNEDDSAKKGRRQSQDFEEDGFKMFRERRNSDVNNAIFDLAEQEDLQQCHKMLEANAEELKEKDALIVKLERQLAVLNTSQ